MLLRNIQALRQEKRRYGYSADGVRKDVSCGAAKAHAMRRRVASADAAATRPVSFLFFCLPPNHNSSSFASLPLIFALIASHAFFARQPL